MKIAIKAYAFTMILMLFIIISSYGVLYFGLPPFYRNQIIRDIEQKTDLLVNTLKETTTKEEKQVILNQFTIDNNVQPILTSDEESIFSIPIVINDISTLQQFPGRNTENNLIEYNLVIDPSNVYIVKREIIIDDNIYDLTLTVPLKPVSEAVNIIANMMPYLLLFSIGICSVATLFYSKAITKPIISISNTMEQMKKMDKKAYSVISSKDEIGELSKNLNALYQRHLENMQKLNDEMERVLELEKSRKQFMQAASHELKTPIASLKGIIEGMIDKVGIYKDRDTFLVECNHLLMDMESLTKKILAAATNELEIQQADNVSISELIEQVLINVMPLAQKKRITIESEIPQGIFITSSLITLEQILSNIITNAILYAEEPYDVKISLTNQTSIEITVYNSCQPLSESEINRVFEPFYRLEKSRIDEIEGSGLGLTIVSQLANSLHIETNFTSTPDGMYFIIIFP